MNVLLVKPAARLDTIRGLQRFQLLEPLELGYLAAAVPPPHVATVLDLRLFRFPRRIFMEAIRRLRPRLVGISGYSHEAAEVKVLAALARQIHPDAVVVVGGHHATVAPSDFAMNGIDAVVRGEGSGPFGMIVEAVARGEALDGILNTVVSGSAGSPRGTWPTFPDPATLPVPRRSLWPSNRYRAVWVCEQPEPWQPLFPPVALVRSSYGCKMRCSFCVVPLLCGGRHMARPPVAVAEEIAGLEQDHVYFVDDENFIDEQFASSLADELERRNVRKRYFAWTRSTTVLRSPELVRRWRDIGLDGAFLGFEFTTDDELRSVGKGGTVAANERALDRLRGLGIAVHAAFMIRPEYTEEQFGALRRYVSELPPAQCSFTVCTPSPGSEDYAAIEKDIWVEDPHTLHDCMHPLTPTTLPLRRFSELYGELVGLGVSKTPLRAARRPLRPADIARIVHADLLYRRAFRRIYRDYPRPLWD